MEKLKIAVVGVGSISVCHIKAYIANPNVEVYAFCDINERQLHKMGDRFGITRLYTDEAEMLRECPEIDAVSVCTWNSEHKPCSIMALDAGKHVLCEKPMALNAKEAMEMQEAAERNGKLLMIGFVRRFGNDCKIVKDLAESDTLGEIYLAKAQNLRRNGNPCGWFGDKARAGGGPLIDLGVHSIDLVRYLLGKPLVTSVYGATFHKLGNRNELKTPKGYVSASATDHDVCDCEDVACATVRFDNGAVLTVDMSFSLNVGKGDNSVQLFGTKAGVRMAESVEVYSDLGGYLSNVTLEGNTGWTEKAFNDEIDHFVDCITGKESTCISPAEDGVELMRILDAIYRSAESGHEEVVKR